MAGRASGADSVPDDLVEVGRIVAAHGVRGWLKIQPYSADAQALLRAAIWWLKPPAAGPQAGMAPSARAIEVRTSRLHGGRFVVAQFEGIADRTAAEALQGCTVWASRAAFPEAGEDEYYWVDLIGCDFFGQSGEASCFLGRVDEVFDNGAHAVLRVARGVLDGQGGFQPEADARGRPVHVLVPFVQAHVQRVDLAARRIDSDWPADF